MSTMVFFKCLMSSGVIVEQSTWVIMQSQVSVHSVQHVWSHAVQVRGGVSKAVFLARHKHDCP